MRVLIFGDSITQGFWDVGGGWVSHIRAYYDQKMIDSTHPDPPTVFNLGVSGDSSDDLLLRIENEIKSRATEDLAIVIAIGVNDSRTKSGKNYSDITRFRKNLIKILKVARKYSEKIIFIGLTPCVEEKANPVSWGDTGYTNSRIKKFDDCLGNFCNENGLPFVEIFEYFSEEARTELLADGLHPNETGHKFIASLVKPHLQSLLS